MEGAANKEQERVIKFARFDYVEHGTLVDKMTVNGFSGNCSVTYLREERQRSF